MCQQECNDGLIEDVWIASLNDTVDVPCPDCRPDEYERWMNEKGSAYGLNAGN